MKRLKGVARAIREADGVILTAYLLVAVVAAGICVMSVLLVAELTGKINPGADTASAATAACRLHHGVQQIQSGLFSGLDAVCKDGSVHSLN